MIQLADQYGVNNASLSTTQIQTEAGSGTYNAVWAAFQASTWTQYNKSGSTMILSRYAIPFEDEYLISGCDLSCWQAQHPDWVMYACDQNGSPTTQNPWSYSGFPNDVPLNIHNQQVVNYELNNVLLPYMQAHGYNAIAIDQVTFLNFLAAPNPVLGQGNPQSGWYSCGVYTQGPNVPSSFQRVYGSAGSSDFDIADQTFISDELNWVATAKQILGAAGMKVLINHPPVGATPSGNEATLLGYVDGVVDENGFSNYGAFGPPGNNPGSFTDTLSWVQAVQNMGKAVFLADYFCQSSCGSSAGSLSGAQVDFALATYAIANSGGLGLYTAPQGVGQYSYRSEYSTSYGTPCGAATQSGSLFVRKFQNGLAIFNNSTSAQSYTLPNHTYTDIEQGHIAISGPGAPITINGGDGAMLLLNPVNGTGCQ
jgi:hypothetical protein